MIRTAFGIAITASLIGVLASGLYEAARHANVAGYEPHDNAVPPYMPPEGMVPDARTAVAIAEAVLEPIYGRDQIRDQRPFHAKLHGDRWVVHGTFWCPFCFGGVAVIEINKRDGRVLYVMHGK